MEQTDWGRYGVGRDPRCDNCMAHCGFEGTAIEDMMQHPLRALRVALRGPRVEGPMAPEVPFVYDERRHQEEGEEAHVVETGIPVQVLERSVHSRASGARAEAASDVN